MTRESLEPKITRPAQKGDSSRSGAGARPLLMLVHGAWHGSWCGSALQAELTDRGLDSRAIDLPSAGRSGRPPAGLREDVEALTDALVAVDGPVMVVAHSYGGIPATEAAVRAGNVAHLVYAAAFRLAAGQSLRSASGMSDVDTEYLPVPEQARRLFFNDIPDEQAAQFVSRLVPQSSRSFSDALGSGAEAIPSASYVICQNDQVLPVALQERFADGIATTSMATGHSPFLADPAGLATLLDSAARSTMVPS